MPSVKGENVRKTRASAALLLALAVMLPLFLLLPQSAHAQAVDNFVWVTNLDSDTVSKVDKATTSVVATIPAGDAPNGVAVDPEFVWVANTFSNTVSKISKTTSSVVATIPVDVTGFEPGVTVGVAVDADSVWVVSRNINSDNSGRISKINKFVGSVVATINLGGNFVAVDESFVWVTQHFPGTVLKIDKVTASVVATISLGFGPGGIKADDSNVWVAMKNDRLVKIDKSTNSVTMITLGGLLAHVAVDENAVWVTGVCCEGTPIIPGFVYRVNRFTAAIEATVSVDNAGGVAVDTDFVWVTNFKQVNTLSKISKSTNSVVATTPVGQHPVMAGDGTGFAYDFFFAPRVREVRIDIKPGFDKNVISLNSKTPIPVAILGESDFDARRVDSSTVRFGRTGTEASPVGPIILADVNGDGLFDMVLSFRTRDTGIQKGDTQATLTGMTLEGISIRGSDSIIVK